MSVRERILAFYRRYPAMIALTYFPFNLLGFVLVEQVVEPRHIIWCPLDDLIPFCEYFIVPYATWFVELAVIPAAAPPIRPKAILLSLRCDVHRYDSVSRALSDLPKWIGPAGGDYPAEHLCRPGAPDPGGGYTDQCLSVNPCGVGDGNGIWPSAAACWGRGRWVRMLANSVFVLICLSTVFLKQHSVIDIFWGVAVTAVLHLVFSRRFMPEPTQELVHS